MVELTLVGQEGSMAWTILEQGEELLTESFGSSLLLGRLNLREQTNKQTDIETGKKHVVINATAPDNPYQSRSGICSSRQWSSPGKQ